MKNESNDYSTTKRTTQTNSPTSSTCTPQPPKQPGEYSKDNGILFMDKEFNQENLCPL